MKAVQTRSPIHLFYEYANLYSVNLSIWVSDTQSIDSTTTPDYSLTTTAINELASFEIAELIRSKNNYIFDSDFYTNRDTAKFVLVKAVLLDDTQAQLEVKYDYLRARDGYLTRDEHPQIYKNIIPTDVRDWENISNTTITANQTNYFNENNSYLIENTNTSGLFIISNSLNLQGVHTLSMFVKPLSTEAVVSIGVNNTLTRKINFDLRAETVTFTSGGASQGFDIYKIGDWYKLSVAFDMTDNDSFRFASEISTKVSVLAFNPKVVKGNTINVGASNLLLQDNTSFFDTSNIRSLFLLDRKFTTYDYNFLSNDFTNLFSNNRNSIFVSAASGDLNYINTNNQNTFQTLTRLVLDECKYTPSKVSFVNRFGVIQDLVFFKKREDTIQTSKEDYKANVLQGSEYYSHIGQNQVISKESKRTVSLNTGFYPESFNTVFEQLQNSLYYWIDDEPANLEGSQLQIKTQVNDKLINYTFEFAYSNEEINTIR